MEREEEEEELTTEKNGGGMRESLEVTVIMFAQWGERRYFCFWTWDSSEDDKRRVKITDQ